MSCAWRTSVNAEARTSPTTCWSAWIRPPDRHKASEAAPQTIESRGEKPQRHRVHRAQRRERLSSLCALWRALEGAESPERISRKVAKPQSFRKEMTCDFQKVFRVWVGSSVVQYLNAPEMAGSFSSPK